MMKTLSLLLFFLTVQYYKTAIVSIILSNTVLKDKPQAAKKVVLEEFRTSIHYCPTKEIKVIKPYFLGAVSFCSGV